MKEFDQRNIIKKKIQKQKKDIYINEKEVRFARLWQNIGNEENGKGKYFSRPVLVMKRFWNMYFILPMTTSWKENRFYFTLPNHCLLYTSDAADE